MVIQAEPRLFFPGFEWNWYQFALGFQSVEVLGRNPNRVSIFWSTNSFGTVGVSTEIMGSPNDGLILTEAQAAQPFIFANFGPMLGEVWYANDDSGIANLTVLEVIYNPNLLALRAKE